MQRYYRAAKLVQQANVIMLQNLHARLLPIDVKPRPVGANFFAIDELLHIRDEHLFEREPSAILDAFLTMMRHPELKGMSARTLRALVRNRHRIDAAFRRDPANRAKFIQVFRERRGLTHELRRMNLYGILGSYLPAFGRIVGQMQHDLFHVYTVDVHIVMVIRNLRRFTEPQHAHEYPLCSRLIADFERKEVLYLAGLFHDIAKGRGGDHSALGELDARRFCRAHGLPPEDTELVTWLVGEHLSMSATAQKQDVNDPDVVAAFAARVGTERRLSALYLLTVADIRGTSPKVWNAWKARLLEDLFHATRARLIGAPRGTTLADSLQERQTEARRLLRLYAVPEESERGLWSQLDNVYFQHQTADEIAWHARHLFYRTGGTKPVVKARLARDGAGLQVFVYLPDQKDLFARICGFFGRSGLSILDAKIHTTRDGYALDTFAVHDPTHTHPSYRETIQFVEFELARVLELRPPLELPAGGPHLAAPQAPPAVAADRDLPRRQGHALHPGDRRRRPPRLAGADRLHAGPGERQRRQRPDQHAGRARRGRVPARRRAAARRTRAAAARDGAVRPAAHLSAGGFGRQSSDSSTPGNSTSVNPKRERSRIRIGYRMPARWSHSCWTTRAWKPSTSRRIARPAGSNPS